MQSNSESARRGRSVRAALRAACLAALLGGAAPAGAVAEGVVNVNTATAEELARLPGVGESKARAILEYRKERGAFKSVDQLREVKGIGDAALERLRPHLVLEGKTTLP